MPQTYEQSEVARQALYNKVHESNKKTTKGYEHNVPCPWCGKHNDHTSIPREQGIIIDCDHCGNVMTVVKVVQKPVIQVKQCHSQTKPLYEAKDRAEWEAEQREAARTATANADIDASDAKRTQLLGADADLLQTLRPLNAENFAVFVKVKNQHGRALAISKLQQILKQQIDKEKAKNV